MTEGLQSPAGKTQAAVAALWERFAEKFFERLSLLERTCDALRKGNLNEELHREAVTAAHKLAGSLGTFGLGRGSKLAEEMESLLDAGNLRDPARSARLAELADNLRKELEQGPPPPA